MEKFIYLHASPYGRTREGKNTHISIRFYRICISHYCLLCLYSQINLDCMRNLIIITALLFGGYYIYDRYTAGSNLQIKLKSLTIGNNLSYGQPLPLATVFTFTNPTSSSIDINGISGNIYANGSLISTINANTTVNISPNSSIDYPVNFSVTVTSLLTQIITLFTTKKNVTVSFDGTVSVEGLNIPYSTSTTV